VRFDESLSLSHEGRQSRGTYLKRDARNGEDHKSSLRTETSGLCDIRIVGRSAVWGPSDREIRLVIWSMFYELPRAILIPHTDSGVNSHSTNHAEGWSLQPFWCRSHRGQRCVQLLSDSPTASVYSEVLLLPYTSSLMKPFSTGETVSHRHLSYWLQTPISETPGLPSVLTNVFHQIRRSRPLVLRSSDSVALEFMAAAVKAQGAITFPVGFTGAIRHITLESGLAGESIQLILGQCGWAS
jgi:hypothetical protein